MTNPVFPTTVKGQDSKFYEVGREDPALKSDMEGGYVVSRAKHTRRPRRKFKTGFSSIGDADRKTLEGFYDLVRGASVVFDWTDPVDELVYQVRFAQPPTFKYVGIGYTRLWDVTIEMDQA